MLPWLRQVAERWPSGIGIACAAAIVTCQDRSVASVIVASRQAWRSGHQFAGSREGHSGFLHPLPRLRAGAVELGPAACRERVRPYVMITVADVSLKNKTHPH